jgi:hypothetical protein
MTPVTIGVLIGLWYLCALVVIRRVPAGQFDLLAEWPDPKDAKSDAAIRVGLWVLSPLVVPVLLCLLAIVWFGQTVLSRPK